MLHTPHHITKASHIASFAAIFAVVVTACRTTSAEVHSGFAAETTASEVTIHQRDSVTRSTRDSISNDIEITIQELLTILPPSPAIARDSLPPFILTPSPVITRDSLHPFILATSPAAARDASSPFILSSSPVITRDSLPRVHGGFAAVVKTTNVKIHATSHQNTTTNTQNTTTSDSNYTTFNRNFSHYSTENVRKSNTRYTSYLITAALFIITVTTLYHIKSSS